MFMYYKFYDLICRRYVDFFLSFFSSKKFKGSYLVEFFSVVIKDVLRFSLGYNLMYSVSFDKF